VVVCGLEVARYVDVRDEDVKVRRRLMIGHGRWEVV